jgi:hypothetical protein
MTLVRRFLLAGIALGAACGTPYEAAGPGGGFENQRIGAPVPPARPEGGATLEQAQAASLRLEPGLLRDQVARILGPPTNTETVPAGEATGHAWQALLWNYVWYDGTPGRKALALFFEFDDHVGWRLNSWRWL